MRTRFAPSPTGLLHLGHAWSAIFAMNHGDECLLRLEDLDRARCRPEYEEALIEDLRWIGFEWSGQVVRQSERSAAYAAALDRLREDGLAYPCFCSRREIAEEIARSASAPQGPDGPLYPGTCRGRDPSDSRDRIASGEPHVWRLDMTQAARRHSGLSLVESGEVEPARPEVFGDVVLARRDAEAAYHLAVVVDDAWQEIGLVTRGGDLRRAAHLHRLLIAALDLPVPEWRHHALVGDESGRRLAKRDGARSLESLRRQGLSPTECLELAERLLIQNDES
ncbi:MAG: tRNA glutamyl-Q(34) synthetase GluQRS [Fimbriimonadaceae bacterium]|nr:tRNA glutamyl-Q(34) synthetase GluQRS [Fimbriimonadaceae bacterium]